MAEQTKKEKTEKTQADKKLKVKIKNTYIGKNGNFYSGKVYELSETFAKDLISNGDAEK